MGYFAAVAFSGLASSAVVGSVTTGCPAATVLSTLKASPPYQLLLVVVALIRPSLV